MMSHRAFYQPEVLLRLVISESSGGNEIHLPEGRAVHPLPYLVRSSFRCVFQGSAVFGPSCFPGRLISQFCLMFFRADLAAARVELQVWKQ